MPQELLLALGAATEKNKEAKQIPQDNEREYIDYERVGSMFRLLITRFPGSVHPHNR
jgi:hypothetical protein